LRITCRPCCRARAGGWKAHGEFFKQYVHVIARCRMVPDAVTPASTTVFSAVPTQRPMHSHCDVRAWVH
jgi:hypothetical protein